MPRIHTYSQHFLRSPRLVAELVGHTNIRKNDTVIDLGAGSGVISSVLAGRVRQVIAVENEPEALQLLRRNLGHVENVSIVRGDILNFVLPKQGSYKIFSNIPFHMSSDIVRKLTSEVNPPQTINLIVQRQFARKLMSDHDGFTSQLGMQLAPWWTVRIRKPLRKDDFTPPPGVDTVLIEIKPRQDPMLEMGYSSAYKTFISECFEVPEKFKKLTGKTSPSRLAAKEFIGLFERTQKDRKPQ